MNSISEKTRLIIDRCEKKAEKIFKQIDAVALFNQQKVLDAFKENKIALRHFSGSSGYGYNDGGKEALNNVFAGVFKTEAAIASPLIASGTHAIAAALFGLLRPDDIMLSISGKPYDTLDGAIKGKRGEGGLCDFNIKYMQIDLKDNGFDTAKIKDFLKNNRPKIVYIQRSKGYQWRNALSMAQIKAVIEDIRGVNADCIIVTDNCYGEFTDFIEPSEAGADVVIGSLIKNAGGGLAPTGAYIAGKNNYIRLISHRLTAPVVGNEVGSYMYGYQYFFQGLFMAPHIVAQALKGSVLLGFAVEELGYKTLPPPDVYGGDVVRSIRFDSKDKLVKFCQSIQSASPVDSFLRVEPSDMPGYDSPVLMAAGCFVQGGSIELSCDSPIKEPYIAYVQGGLTYEHAKIAINNAIEGLII